VSWFRVVCFLPLAAPLAIELVIPLVRRPFARMFARMFARKSAQLERSTNGPYRDSPTPTVSPEPPSYFSHWERYRRARLSCWVVWLSFPLSLALSLLLKDQVLKDLEATFLLGACWSAGLIFTALRWEFFRCPHCKSHFRAPTAPVPEGSTWPVFPRLCQNCALRMFAPRSEIHEPGESGADGVERVDAP